MRAYLTAQSILGIAPLIKLVTRIPKHKSPGYSLRIISFMENGKVAPGKLQQQDLYLWLTLEKE